MNVVSEPRLKRDDRNTAQSVPPTPPSSEAFEQDTSEWAVLPGSPAYRRWLELLRDGTISYEEFTDWTTPGHFPSRRKQWLSFLETLRSGFAGFVWRR